MDLGLIASNSMMLVSVNIERRFKPSREGEKNEERKHIFMVIFR